MHLKQTYFVILVIGILMIYGVSCASHSPPPMRRFQASKSAPSASSSSDPPQPRRSAWTRVSGAMHAINPFSRGRAQTAPEPLSSSPFPDTCTLDTMVDIINYTCQKGTSFPDIQNYGFVYSQLPQPYGTNTESHRYTAMASYSYLRIADMFAELNSYVKTRSIQNKSQQKDHVQTVSFNMIPTLEMNPHTKELSMEFLCLKGVDGGVRNVFMEFKES